MDKHGYSFVIMVKGMYELVNSLVLENKGTFENKWAKHIDEYDVYGTTVKRKMFETDSKERYFHIYHSIGKESGERILLAKKLRQMKTYMMRHTNEVINFGPEFSIIYSITMSKMGDSLYLRSPESDYLDISNCTKCMKCDKIKKIVRSVSEKGDFMTESYVVRIIKSELQNFKNVKYGEVKYMNYGCVQKYGEIQKKDIVGIYGQNGSGKTALIEYLDIMKYILLGTEIPYGEYAGIISEAEGAHVTTWFLLEKGDTKYRVKYEATLCPNKQDEKIEIIDETLTYWTRGASWNAERDIYFKNPYYGNKDILVNDDLSIQSKHMEYFKSIQFLRSMSVLAAVSAQGHHSVLFNDKAISTLKLQGTPERWNDREYVAFYDILDGLHYFANTYFHVIKVSQLGDINQNRLIPLNMHYETDTAIIQGCIPLFTNGHGEVLLTIYDLFVATIKSINIAIRSIIPDLQIELEKKMELEKEDGKKYVQVEVYSKRNGRRFLTKFESEGVKRIISLLSYLVSAYNQSSVCLVVDELDSGIFEYLLGELLGVLKKEMKGQLIFTSHNLRALEKLDYKNIVCSTTNPDNRYIKLVGVGANNNNRDFYIKSITIGGQKEELYEDEELDSIGYAFRKAGNSGKEPVKLHFSEEIYKKIEEEKKGNAHG